MLIKKSSVLKKSNSYKRISRNFDNEKFQVDVKAINWDDLLIDNKDVNGSFKKLLITLNDIRYSHAPIIKVAKIELSF